MDYKNGKIYKITDIAYTKMYIGSTCQPLSKRFSNHKANYKMWKDGKRCKITSYELFDEFGVENCKIELIEEFACENKSQLERKEGEHIKNNECINKVIVGRTIKEWYIDNVDKVKQQQKDYYIDNADKIKERMKEYYIDNKDKVKEQKKEYYIENADKVKQQSKQYKELNKDKVKEQNKKYRIDNADKVKQYNKEYYLKKKLANSTAKTIE